MDTDKGRDTNYHEFRCRKRLKLCAAGESFYALRMWTNENMLRKPFAKVVFGCIDKRSDEALQRVPNPSAATQVGSLCSRRAAEDQGIGQAEHERESLPAVASGAARDQSRNR